MGTYKSIRIMADTKSPEEISGIRMILKNYKAEDCWNHFCVETKWWPDELMVELREKYPQVMFRVDLDGVQAETEFHLGNEVVKESFIFLFPNKKQFNLGLRAKTKHHKQFLAAQRKAEAARRKAAAEELEKQEREQLRVLKLKYG